MEIVSFILFILQIKVSGVSEAIGPQNKQNSSPKEQPTQQSPLSLVQCSHDILFATTCPRLFDFPHRFCPLFSPFNVKLYSPILIICNFPINLGKTFFSFYFYYFEFSAECLLACPKNIINRKLAKVFRRILESKTKHIFSYFCLASLFSYFLNRILWKCFAI